MPIMVALMSEKSRLMRPGVMMMSLMPWTAWRSRSSATLKASKKLVPRGTSASRRSLGMAITVSTVPASRPRPSSARRMRRGPSKANGLVTTATVRASSSLKSAAMTGAAPVPVPPPSPAVTKTMSAPCRISTMRSVFSSAAWRPTSGLEPAPRPLVILAPSCSLLGTRQAVSAWRSVFMAWNSTPSRPSSTMRATALHPPPPTPITLMRVPRRASSSISYFRSSMSASMMSSIVSSLSNRVISVISQPAGVCPPFLSLELGGVHGESRGGRPLGIVHALGPVLNSKRQAEARLALQDAFGNIAKRGRAGRAAGEEDTAHQGAIHPHAGQFGAHETEQFLGAGFDDLVDETARRVTVLAIPGGGQIHQHVFGAGLRERRAVFQFDQFGVFEAEAEALSEVARKMVTANADGGRQVQGVAVVNHQLGGLGADIDDGDAFAALIGQHGGVACAEGFEDGFFHGQVRLVHGAHQGVVFLHRASDYVHIDFEPGRQHLARVAVAGVIVHHEILREQLQEHAVFLQLHAGSAVHHAVDIGLIDFAHVDQLQNAAAVGAANGGPAEAHDHGFDGGTGGGLGLAQSRQNGSADGALIGDAALQPTLRRHG